MQAAYIHIPFCKQICSYCDFCKVFYQKELVSRYLDALEKEIQVYYQGERLTTLYIGGGTPSALSLSELEKLLTILQKLKKDSNIEYTIECNIQDITLEKALLFQKYGINRISIGIQTLQEKYLQILNRKHTYQEVQEKIDLLKKQGFHNINIDFMYAFPNETVEEVKKDIESFLTLGATHISTYALMIEPHTQLYLQKVENPPEEIEAHMYQIICETLAQNGYDHYEISNFSKPGYASKHNTVYWNQDFYYGFGVGASGYQNNMRYENTKSIYAYIKGKSMRKEYLVTGQDKLYEAIMLGFRKIKGISKERFYQKQNQRLEEIPIIQKLIQEQKLIENKDNIYINPKYIYVMNEILVIILNDIEGVKNA